MLVSWNGLAFDLPVLMHRSMHHQLSAPALFGSAQKFGYSYRYGEMHIDLMDKTALHNNKLHQNLIRLPVCVDLLVKAILMARRFCRWYKTLNGMPLVVIVSPMSQILG